MKFIIAVILFCFISVSCKKNATLIEYDVTLIDPMTNQEVHNPYMNIDRQFAVKFNDEFIRIWQKYADEYSEIRVIDKNEENVLFLSEEGKNKGAFYLTIREMHQMDKSQVRARLYRVQSLKKGLKTPFFAKFN